MCGRYALTTPPAQVAALFELSGALPPDWRPRYNIAPGQDVPVVHAEADADTDSIARVLDPMRWGLVPHWAPDPAAGPAPINARSETAATRPAFREPFRHRRCLLPCDGFYEWKKLDPDGRRKQPMFIRLAGGGTFALAGLWDRWRPRDGAGDGDGARELRTCTVLTTDANDLLRPIHDRMPVILPHEHWATWLDPRITDPARVQGLLRPFPADRLEAWPVSTAVNRPANDGPDLIRRVEPAPPPAGPPPPGLFD
jgi:putative SOS response-associated peptidase YedK